MLDHEILGLLTLEDTIQATLAALQKRISHYPPMEGSRSYCPCYSKAVEAKNYSANEAADSYTGSKGSKPRSASAGTSKRNDTQPLKAGTSDSRLAKGHKSKKDEEKSSVERINSEDVKHLKKELNAIKQQLIILTRNKKDAERDSEELNAKYMKLVRNSQEQERRMECLEMENRKLREGLKQRNEMQKNTQCDEYKVMVKAKENLDEYGEKLSQLYDEFVESSKVMEQNRDMLCSCIKKKSMQFKEISQTQSELSRALEEKDAKFDDLKRKYQALLCNLNDQEKKNQELKEASEKLQNCLNGAAEQLDNAKNAEQEARNEIQILKCENCCLTGELEEKSAIVEELNGSVAELQKRLCECSKESDDELKALQQKYDSLCSEYKTLVQRFKVNEQKDLKKYGETQCVMKSAQDREKKLIMEQKEMKKFISEMAERIKAQEEMMARMNCLLEEKEFVIQSQQAELSMKDRQLQLSAESISKDPVRLSQDNGVCSSNCSSLPNLSEELQHLINALYAEIDKTMSKERIIRKQFKEICCLQGTLASKDKEIICLRYQLDTVKRRVEECLRAKQKEKTEGNKQSQLDRSYLFPDEPAISSVPVQFPGNGKGQPKKAAVLFSQDNYYDDACICEDEAPDKETPLESTSTISSSDLNFLGGRTTGRQSSEKGSSFLDNESSYDCDENNCDSSCVNNEDPQGYGGNEEMPPTPQAANNGREPEPETSKTQKRGGRRINFCC